MSCLRPGAAAHALCGAMRVPAVPRATAWASWSWGGPAGWGRRRAPGEGGKNVRRQAIGGDARAVKSRPASLWAGACRLICRLMRLGEEPSGPGPALVAGPKAVHPLAWTAQSASPEAQDYMKSCGPGLIVWLSLGPSPAPAYLRWQLDALVGGEGFGPASDDVLVLGCAEPRQLPQRLLAAARAPGVTRIVVEMGSAEAQAEAISGMWGQGCVGLLEAALRQSGGRVLALGSAPAPAAPLMRPFVRLGPIL